MRPTGVKRGKKLCVEVTASDWILQIAISISGKMNEHDEPLDLWYPTFRQPHTVYPQVFFVHMDNDDRAWILCNVEVPFGMEPGDYDVRLAFGEKIIHGRLKRNIIFHRIIGSHRILLREQNRLGI